MKIDNNSNVSFKALQLRRIAGLEGSAKTTVDNVNRFNILRGEKGQQCDFMIFKTPKIEAVASRILTAALGNTRVLRISEKAARHFSGVNS